MDEYPDGVWFVELAPLADADRVPQAVASVLGVKEDRDGRRSRRSSGSYAIESFS
jgi:predicted ATPase